MIASSRRISAPWLYELREGSEQPACTASRWPAAPVEDGWLASRLDPIAVRRRLPAQSTLFEPGDAARRYYMVESGRLLVRGGTLGQPPAMTIACDGTLLIYDCGETHVVSCHVVTASVVLVVDRRRLERAAETDAALMGALRSAHAGELGMILKSLGITQVPYRSVRPGAPSRRMRQPELRLISGRPRSALDAGPGRSRPAHTGS